MVPFSRLHVMSAKAKNASKVPSFTLAELRDATVRLPAEIGESLSVQAELHHSLRYGTTTPLNATWLTEPPPSHRLTLHIYRDDFTGEMVNRELRSAGGHTRWRSLRSIDALTATRDRERAMPYVTIASLRVVELPDHVRRAAGESWFTWLDGEGSNLGDIADTIARDFARWMSGLVRPSRRPSRFRRQHVGAKLLAHALWLLVDDE